MTGRDTWRMVWATDGVAEDLDRLPQNLMAASLAMRAKAAVVGLTLGRWDKELAGHTYPLLGGFVEVKFDLPDDHSLRRGQRGEGRHGPRFRVIAECHLKTRTIGVWAIGPKNPRAFAGQPFSALELAEMRVIAKYPERAVDASADWRRRHGKRRHGR